jgi:hypothetical protein
MTSRTLHEAKPCGSNRCGCDARSVVLWRVISGYCRLLPEHDEMMLSSQRQGKRVSFHQPQCASSRRETWRILLSSQDINTLVKNAFDLAPIRRLWCICHEHLSNESKRSHVVLFIPTCPRVRRPCHRCTSCYGFAKGHHAVDAATRFSIQFCKLRGLDPEEGAPRESCVNLHSENYACDSRMTYLLTRNVSLLFKPKGCKACHVILRYCISSGWNPKIATHHPGLAAEGAQEGCGSKVTSIGFPWGPTCPCSLKESCHVSRALDRSYLDCGSRGVRFGLRLMKNPIGFVSQV